ncbi:hypothetical protein NLU13_7660 [Sarocladium strictum]|uniref:NADH:ubiquinone oxidoreductase intermediate-associated protein 30 domain-containing protein n=1 Tax=Sarocladium strictum TaxID=5046 RepID=A0AA39GFK7_SARSR|nr:hypothetical protein NLU13_7660 [Sarocladium strictum]
MASTSSDVTSSGTEVRYLFGGKVAWDESLWTATDDRVRGGSSSSHLTVERSSSCCPEFARFSGHLDTSTLGGAGFASQRTKGELDLDLSEAVGLCISVCKSDGKRYLLTLKDEIPGQRDDGREMSGITWEADFTADESTETSQAKEVFLPWNAFKATYRGRSKDDAKPLNLKSIKRVSFMMRSFFDEQKGDFSIDIASVAAIPSTGSTHSTVGPETVVGEEEEVDLTREKADAVTRQQQRQQQPQPQPPTSWWRRMLCGLM